jgi:hypothetical protein
MTALAVTLVTACGGGSTGPSSTPVAPAPSPASGPFTTVTGTFSFLWVNGEVNPHTMALTEAADGTVTGNILPSAASVSGRVTPDRQLSLGWPGTFGGRGEMQATFNPERTRFEGAMTLYRDPVPPDPPTIAQRWAVHGARR